MRSAAFVLLFLAVGSLQLPWVTCEVEALHLDLGHAHTESGCGHDHGDPEEPDDHEAVDWSAIPGSPATATVVAPAVYGGACVQALPLKGEGRVAIRAKAAAPPIAAGPPSAVLLL